MSHDSWNEERKVPGTRNVTGTTYMLRDYFGLWTILHNAMNDGVR